MGICAKHDWSSFGPERCPGCVSDAVLARGIVPDVGALHAIREQALTDEEAFGTELGVLRTILKQKEERIGELLAVIEKSNVTIQLLRDALVSLEKRSFLVHKRAEQARDLLNRALSDPSDA